MIHIRSQQTVDMYHHIYILLFSFMLTNCYGQATQVDLKITPLTGDFYIYTTYNLYQGNRISANGMYVVTQTGVVMIDTPWDTTQFQPLLDSIKARHSKKVVMCIATHFHDDRTGGLDYYRKQGIKTYTTNQTDVLSKTRGMKRAEFLINKDTIFAFGQYSFETYFPGHGHAPDNIVIWFKKDKILYGGCLIKSTEATSLGNLGDANVKEYPNTLERVLKTYKDPKYVIPGHDSWTNVKSIQHTLVMARAQQQKNNR